MQFPLGRNRKRSKCRLWENWLFEKLMQEFCEKVFGHFGGGSKHHRWSKNYLRQRRSLQVSFTETDNVSFVNS